MKKYKYTWEQSDTYVCEFEAKNEEEALNIINDNFDYSKGKLIELCSKIKIKEPVYYLIDELLSTDDNKIFNIKLEVGNKYFFGKGSKLKDAEENASSKALDFFSI